MSIFSPRLCAAIFAERISLGAKLRSKNKTVLSNLGKLSSSLNLVALRFNSSLRFLVSSGKVTERLGTSLTTGFCAQQGYEADNINISFKIMHTRVPVT